MELPVRPSSFKGSVFKIWWHLVVRLQTVRMKSYTRNSFSLGVRGAEAYANCRINQMNYSLTYTNTVFAL